jgi:hypothetical protein
MLPIRDLKDCWGVLEDVLSSVLKIEKDIGFNVMTSQKNLPSRSSIYRKRNWASQVG